MRTLTTDEVRAARGEETRLLDSIHELQTQLQRLGVQTVSKFALAHPLAGPGIPEHQASGPAHCQNTLVVAARAPGTEL